MRAARGLRILSVAATVAAVGADALGVTNEPPVAPPKVGAAVSILLFADLSEAGASCGCGQIIRAVRAAHKRGVPTTEIVAGKDESRDLARRHKVLVAPAVIFLDASGQEVRRFEGESADTIRALRADLAKVPGKKP